MLVCVLKQTTKTGSASASLLSFREFASNGSIMLKVVCSCRGLEEADFRGVVKARCPRLVFTHVSAELVLACRDGGEEQGSCPYWTVGIQRGCLAQGPCSLCCHTGESSSFHGCFAELLKASSLCRGWVAQTCEQPLSDKSQGDARGLYPQNRSVSVGGSTGLSQAETFPFLSCEASQLQPAIFPDG